MNFKVVSLSRANSQKMDLSSWHCVAMAKRKNNTIHKEHEEEPPSSGVDSKSSDDMIWGVHNSDQLHNPGCGIRGIYRGEQDDTKAQHDAHKMRNN